MKLHRMAVAFFLTLAVAVGLSFSSRTALSGQGWQIDTGVNLGAPKIKLAVPDFPPKSVDQQLVSLTQEFNQVLWNDLQNVGIFEMESKSNYPLRVPEEPLDVDFNAWSTPPASAQMLVFGKAENINSNLVITGRVFDLGNQANPGVLAKRYVATMNEVSTRESAHRFADEIIMTLGGGLKGINETRIAYVSKRSGHAEIWVMDYDGFNQHPITSYGSMSTTPRWSPDNTKLAFTSYVLGLDWQPGDLPLLV
jgi:TolB protein